MLLLLACAPALDCGPGTVAADGLCVVAPADSDSAVDSGDTGDSADSGDVDTADTADSGDTGDTGAPAVLEVYLLAGQSNMDGYGVYTGLPPSLRVGQPDIPLYWSAWGAFGPLAPASAGGSPYTGPEVSLGRTLADAGHSVALVKHAVGGTDLAAYWHPGDDSLDPDVGAGWAVFAATLHAAEAELDASGVAWRWAGFAWMQGESDALVTSYAAAYEENLTRLVRRVREETDTPDLPVVVGLIACEGLCDAGLQTVRAAQAAVADADADVIAIETLDLPRTVSDPWHYDGPSTRVLGERFAQAFLGEPLSSPPLAALTLTSWSNDYDGELTVGWRFTTDRALTVTDVGGFGSDVLWLSQEVGLWDAQSGALVWRGDVPGWYDAPTTWRGGFWYTAVEPFDLPAGDWILGLVSWSGDGNTYVHDARGALGEGVTYVEARYAAGYWLTRPDVALSTGETMAFLGPSFLYRETASYAGWKR